METRLNNSLELLNESTFFLLININFLFTNVIEDMDVKYRIGWGFLCILALNLGLNWIAIVYQTVKTAIKTIKAKF
jgi:hypothetical protein